jgi:hypothetical protein
MATKETKSEKLTLSSSKKEMLAAYNAAIEELEARGEAETKPEQKLKEKEEKQAVQVADTLSTDGIAREIGALRSEVGKMLAQLSDKLEAETEKYDRVKQATAVREQQLKEIYEIEKAASSLTALIQSQAERREQFETDMATRKAELEEEITGTRESWQEEKRDHEAEIKERDEAEKKARTREAEEYKYKTEREKQLLKEQFEYEKARLTREMALKREEQERDLAARQKALADQEADVKQLRERAVTFPAQLTAAVDKAVQEIAARLQRESQVREEMLKKDAEGEKKVLLSRIEALQATCKEQAAQIAKLSGQIEKSYGQVQDIAVKAIEGAASSQALAALQSRSDTSRRGNTEEK